MQLPTVRRAPLVFQLGRLLHRRGVRGGWRLIRLAEQRGWLNKVVRYRLASGVTFDVPIFRPDNRWAMADVLDYDPLLIEDLATVVREAITPPIFVDCGADIGIVTMLLTAKLTANAHRLRRIIAIEPNPDAFQFLERNVSGLSLEAQTRHAAVADFCGRGVLRSPEESTYDHAKYLVSAPEGDVSVIRIDDLGIEADASVILKLDLEGAERPALLGAAETLRQATEFAVAFEAHPAVCERTGEEPSEIIRFINSIRSCAVTVCEVPGLRVDMDKPFFPQIVSPRTDAYNVLCRSITSAGERSADSTGRRNA